MVLSMCAKATKFRHNLPIGGLSTGGWRKNHLNYSTSSYISGRTPGIYSSRKCIKQSKVVGLWRISPSYYRHIHWIKSSILKFECWKMIFGIASCSFGDFIFLLRSGNLPRHQNKELICRFSPHCQEVGEIQAGHAGKKGKLTTTSFEVSDGT